MKICFKYKSSVLNYFPHIYKWIADRSDRVAAGLGNHENENYCHNLAKDVLIDKSVMGNKCKVSEIIKI